MRLALRPVHVCEVSADLASQPSLTCSGRNDATHDGRNTRDSSNDNPSVNEA